MVKNKKGFSIIEIVVAIAVIGLGSTVLMTSVLSTMKSSVRAESYTLAEQIARTYSTLASKNVTFAGVSVLDKPDVTIGDGGKTIYSYKTKTIAGPSEEDKLECIAFFGTDSGIYKALYENEGTMTLNDMKYDANNVKIEIQRLTLTDSAINMYGMIVTVTYMDREVSYESKNMCKG